MIEVTTDTPEKFDDFMLLNQLGKTLYSEDVVKANLSEYLLVQYLRHNPSTLLIADFINQHKTLDLYNKYLFAFSTFKVYGLKAGRWVRSPRAKRSRDEDLIFMATYYNTSTDIAQEYINILPKDEVDRIISTFDYAEVDKDGNLTPKEGKSRRVKTTPTKKGVSL